MYRTWRGDFTAYFTKRIGYDEAEDLTQDLFVRYISSLASGKQIVQPQNWLWRTAHNLVADVFRQRARSWPYAPMAEVMTSASPGPIVHDPEGREQDLSEYVLVDGYLTRLTIVQQDAVILRHWNEWEHRQFAAAAGIPVGAAKARYRRGIKRLMNAMKETS